MESGERGRIFPYGSAGILHRCYLKSQPLSLFIFASYPIRQGTQIG